MIVILLLVESVICLPIRPKGFGSAKYVLQIGIDGLGAVYLDNATHMLPNLARFYSEGSVALPGVARSECITISPPNWVAAIAGVSPSQSGILDYSWDPKDDKKHFLLNDTIEILKEEKMNGTITVPSIIIKNSVSAIWSPPDLPDTHKLIPTKLPESVWEVAKRQNDLIKTAVVYSWSWIGHFVTDEFVNWSYDCNEDDKSCANEMINFIKNESPNLSFIHFDSVDVTGHLYGFGSDKYYETLQEIDGYIGMIFSAMNTTGMLNETLILVMSDHGGYHRQHGYFNEENVFIPALFIGPNVKQNTKLSQYISIMDFPSTVLNALGLESGKHMRGRPIEEIYH